MMKKMLLIPLLIIICLILVDAQRADAEFWAKVSIDRVGQNRDLGSGEFTDTAEPPVFIKQYFQFEKMYSNQLLATVLIAFSLEKNIIIRVKDDGVTIDMVWIDK